LPAPPDIALPDAPAVEAPEAPLVAEPATLAPDPPLGPDPATLAEPAALAPPTPAAEAPLPAWPAEPPVAPLGSISGSKPSAVAQPTSATRATSIRPVFAMTPASKRSHQALTRTINTLDIILSTRTVQCAATRRGPNSGTSDLLRGEFIGSRSFDTGDQYNRLAGFVVIFAKPPSDSGKLGSTSMTLVERSLVVTLLAALAGCGETAAPGSNANHDAPRGGSGAGAGGGAGGALDNGGTGANGGMNAGGSAAGRGNGAAGAGAGAGPSGGGAGSGGCVGISGAPATSGSGDARGALDGLVPLPRSLTAGSGEFGLTAGTPILLPDSATPELRSVSRYLVALLEPATGYTLRVASVSDRACFSGAPSIELELDTSILEPEGYRLEVTPEALRIRGQTAHGVFHGIQTLREILAPEIESRAVVPRARWLVPGVSIDDAPRFSYRGMHLDVSRHFLPPEFVKKYIDLLALYKLNTFHWHLTDDQGWRIEIEAYPRLTEVGAWRNDSNGRYGGFYTQAEVRDIVSYASERFVTIVPEIEMPGHSRAAVAAYPEYACTPGPFDVATTWGVFYDIYCPSEATFTFLEGVLAEIFELFPGKYVHLGGDEAPKDRWETSAGAQGVIDREGLVNETELQGYFMRRVETFAASHGRSIIGWDEILDAGVTPSATIMAWRGSDRGTLAARRGHDVIMTPNGSCYFDHYQGPEATEPPAFPGSFTPLSEVYALQPMPPGLNAEQATHVLGAQGNLWSEYVPTPVQAEYMAFPRAIALAEVIWSDPGALDYSKFVRRLEAHSAHLDALDTNYARHFRDDL